jgi:hypothetical protein
MNAFSYLLFAHDSAIQAVTDRDERRIWSVREYFSSFGKLLEISKISMANL